MVSHVMVAACILHVALDMTQGAILRCCESSACLPCLSVYCASGNCTFQAFLDRHAGYLDEHGTPRDFATRPNGGTATLLSLTQVQRAMAKIASMEKQKHAAPARPSAPKRPRPRSPSPELDISDDDEPEGAHQY